MNKKIDICVQCDKLKPVNSRGVCPDCVYKNNHKGLNQSETYLERSKAKEKTYIRNLPNATKKSKKTMINGLMKDVRLEKRREQINNDEEFYELIFNTTEPICEECGAQLPDEFRDENGMVICRAQYSHILTKGSSPEFRHDPRNINRLCPTCHHTWEFSDRVEMKIYSKNQDIVEILRNEKRKI